MGRNSIIKGYSPEVSLPPKKNEESCYREGCAWILYALITLSLGLAVLTFWLSLLRETETRGEFLSLERTYNETVSKLRSQLTEVRSLAHKNMAQRGNLSREVQSLMKNNNNNLRGSPFGRIMKADVPSMFDEKNQRDIKELRTMGETQFENLTEKINSILQEQGEYRRAIQDLSDSGFETKREIMESMGSLRKEMKELKRSLDVLEMRRTDDVLEILQRELGENKELRELRRGQEDFLRRFEGIERTTEDLRRTRENEGSTNTSLKTLESWITSQNEALTSQILERVLENSNTFEKEHLELQRQLASSKVEALTRLNEVNERVDHFVRSVMRLKNVPQEILLLNGGLRDLSERLDNVINSK
eukprot:TRINITY_DN2642_c0_g1_i1.p1 TRINITY_DN2642_c0_g1~~TRINITY_DN2642_c0_g1_i1.p1  ORF type:complete len:362 (-),score=89.22 TRINITY_DN2642_c0_g1_i1:388-1473(-)